MWLVFSLLFPLLFATVFVIDSYCVGDIFEKSWLGMIVSAAVSLIVFLPLPFVLPWISFNDITWEAVAAGVAAGIIIQICQALYFEALEDSDPGVISAYWNMIPAFVLITSYCILDEVLTLQQYSGIAILVISSVILSIMNANISSGYHSFLLIFVSSWLQVVAIFLMDWLFGFADYYVGFLLVTTGICIAGFFPLLFTDIQKIFKRNLPIIFSRKKLFIVIEIINLLAYGCFQAALKYGNPTLVGSLETLTPAFVVIIALIFVKFFSINIKAATFTKIPYKLALVSVMFIGVLLIS